MMKTIFTWPVFALLTFLLLWSTLGPVINPKPAHCLWVGGELVSMECPNGLDLVFYLKDDPHRYYINRATEKGLGLEEANRLNGEWVEIAVYEKLGWLARISKTTPVMALRSQGHNWYRGFQFTESAIQ